MKGNNSSGSLAVIGIAVAFFGRRVDKAEWWTNQGADFTLKADMPELCSELETLRQMFVFSRTGFD